MGRYYDPATGQFLTVDPLVQLTGAPYFYAGDDPVNGSDPTGLGCGPTFHAPCPGQGSHASCPKGSSYVGGQCTGTGPGQPCPSQDVNSDGFCTNAAWNNANPFAGQPNSYNYACGSFFLQICFAVTGSGSVAVSIGAGLKGVSAGEGTVLGRQAPCAPNLVNSYLSNWSTGIFGGDIFGIGASRNIGGAGLTSTQAGFTTPGFSPWISYGWVF